MGNKFLNIFINYLEFKYKLLYCFFSFIFVFILFFYYKIELFFFISQFFLFFKNDFIYTSLIGPIFIYLKLTLLYSFIYTLPVCIYFVNFYILRAFYTIYINFVSFSVFFICLFGFLNYIIIKNFFLIILFKFLLTYQRIESTFSLQLYLEATINEYFNLIFSLLYLFLFFLFLPVILIFGLLTNEFLSISIFFNKWFRNLIYMFLTMLIIILVPPDAGIQLITIPIFIILIELLIFCMCLIVEAFKFSFFYSQ